MLKSLLRPAFTIAVFSLVLAFALLVALQVSSSAQSAGLSRPAAVPTWGPDVRVNPTSTVALSIQRNFALAINPVNPDQALAGYDSSTDVGNTSAYAWSTNRGQSWVGSQFYGPWISDTVPSGNTSAGFDRDGTAYYTSAVVGNSVSGYVLLTGTVASGWSTPVPIVLAPNSETRDQAHLAVDTRASGAYAGSVYIAWRYAMTDALGIWLRYSRDGGRTWSGDVPVSDPGNEAGEQPSIRTASDGRLYVAFGAEDTDLYLDHSTDGGQTWGMDQLISGAPITPTGALDPKGIEMMLPGGPPDSMFVVTNNPRIAVAPANPQTVYAVWNDGRWDTSFTLFANTGQHGDIAFSRTTDGGSTWSAPLRINDDPVANGIDQWNPQIAVGPDGRIGVIWYDRRDDPQNALYHLYYSESTDGGVTWSANQRVSDVPSDPVAVVGVKGVGDLGDYNALVYGPDYVLPSWVDTRAGREQDFYTDPGHVVAPTATPVPSPSPTATATACATSFTDVHPTDYFYAPVQYLACHGVISGYGDGTFRPYNQTTRAQMVKIVVLGFGYAIQTPATPTFSDVPANHPFYPFIETAAAHNIVSGYADGTFRPSNNVTRGQLSKIDVIAATWALQNPPTGSFADVPAASPFYPYVETAACHGVISGYSCGGPGEPCDNQRRPYFRENNPATRGQIAKIVYLSITGSGATCPGPNTGK